MQWIKLFLGLVFLTTLGFLVHKAGVYHFNSVVTSEVEYLNDQTVRYESRIIEESDLDRLPLPVQKYLRYARVIGKSPVRTAIIKQAGTFSMNLDDAQVDFQATQYYSTDPGGFIWNAAMKVFPGITVAARDKFVDGQGNMWIKFLYLYPIADATGYEMDQASMLRFFNEHVFFPTAYLNAYITWKPIDDLMAEAVISFAGINARALLYFNEEGQMINFEGERYRSLSNQRYELTPWSTPMQRYREMDGFMIPTKGQAVWHLPEGNHTYIDLDITDVQYNVGLTAE